MERFLYEILVGGSDIFGEYLKEVLLHNEDANGQCHIKAICAGAAEKAAERLLGRGPLLKREQENTL